MDFSQADIKNIKNLKAAKNLRTAKHSAPLAKRFAIIIIIFCSAIILLNIVANAYFNPGAVVDREINNLAKEYYEDYLYQNMTTGLSEEEITKELARYEKSGTGNVYLRQLLLYDSGRREDAASYFNHKGYTCDRNKTYVKYYPEPPFKKENYHFEIKLACE